jgi:hypothetical protein
MIHRHARIVLLMMLCLLPAARAGAQEVYASFAENFLTKAKRTTRLVQGPLRFQAFDAGILWRTADTEAAGLFSAPRLGIGFSYTNLGSCECIPGSRLGDTFTLYGRLERTLLPLGIFSAGYDLEFGPALMSHYYDRFDNPDNLLYGGPITLHSKMGVFTRFQLSDHFVLRAELNFRHNSSGRLFVPNGGVNSVSCGLAAHYVVGNNTLKPGAHRPGRDPLEQKWRVAVFAGGGIHRCMAEYDADRLLPPEQRQERYTPWFKGSIGAEVDWRYSRRTSTGVQAEFFYYSNTEGMRRSDTALYGPGERRYSPFAAGIGLIQDLYFGSFTAGIGLGAYLYKQTGVHEDNGRLYQKVDIRYYPPALKRVFFGAAIRAHHFGKADYIELSFGTVL